MNKKEAAAFLGVDERSIQRYAKKGLLSVQLVPGTGTRSVADYNDDDLKELKKQMESGHAAPAQGSALATRRDAAPADRFLALLEKLQPPKHAPVGLKDKYLLSVSEIHQLEGISEEQLRADIRAGTLKGKKVKGRRGLTVKRPDLETYLKKL